MPKLGTITQGHCRGLDTETVKGYARTCAVEGLECWDIDRWRDVETVLKAVAASGTKWLVAYNIDYDVTALCKFLPYRKRALLYKGVGIYHGRTRLLYRPNKTLKVDIAGKRLMLYDAFQYYGCSLRRAAEKWLTKRKLDFDVSAVTLRHIRTKAGREYCMIDAELCGELFRRFLNGLPTELRGVTPISPGFLARRAFREELDANGVLWSVNNLWRKAFRGGRFECFRRGFFRDVFVYDIRSAYPAEISRLYSLAGAGARWSKTWDDSAVYHAVLCDLHITDKFIGPVQVSTRSGLSVCPVGRLTKLWLTDQEYLTCLRLGYITGVHSVCNVYGEKSHPFADRVVEYYKRKQKPDGYAYKKLLNSIYGKTCQTVSRFMLPGKSMYGAIEAARNQWGEYLYRIDDTRGSNFVYASTITAGARMRLFESMAKHRDSIIACFTDSIVSTLPVSGLKLSGSLGDWELKRLDWLYLIGSGIYFYGYEGEVYGRMRGIPLTDAKALYEHIRRAAVPSVSLRSKHRYSFAASQGDDRLENIILDIMRFIDLNFDRKRHWSADFKNGQDDGPHDSQAICYM